MAEGEHTKLRLTQRQRLKLFRGEPVNINGQGPPPVQAGELVRLSSKVALHVHRVNRRGERWSLHYTLKDGRDPVRKLKRTPHAPLFDPSEPTEDAIRDAAEQSAYTSAPTSLSDAGEAVDVTTQKRYSAEAHTHGELRELARRERWEMRSLSDRLAAIEARTGDADLTRILAGIERRVQAAEKKLRAA